MDEITSEMLKLLSDDFILVLRLLFGLIMSL